MAGLRGQTAIVTGAARGIGEAFARRLVAEGCNLTVTDRLERVRAVGDELGATTVLGDVADPAHVWEAVGRTVDVYGSIDILVNNAGEAWATGPNDDWDRAAADYERIFGSNTKGAFLFGRAVAPIMAAGGGGNIVNVSTDHVKPGPGCDRLHGHGGMDLYNASKWALNGLTFDWARSLADSGIRVNNLCMGATETEMLRRVLGPKPDPAYQATWMQPEQTAQILVELLQEGSAGRTADSIGLYAGEPSVMPPPE
ncbi:MAG: SDR family oxidoreductase [Acidimicrobiia bacterium]|nr:SDR family oxidoreductase [Acidimicrobiia bacterium]